MYENFIELLSLISTSLGHLIGQKRIRNQNYNENEKGICGSISKPKSTAHNPDNDFKSIGMGRINKKRLTVGDK